MNLFKKNEVGSVCGTFGNQEKCIQGFGGEPEQMGPLGRHRGKWENTIEMDLEKVGWGGMDCIDLAQDRNRWRVLVNVVVNLRVS